MRIINADLTTDWTDIELKRTYLSGSCKFWTRGGTAFQIRNKNTSEIATILEDVKTNFLDIKTIDGAVFQARTISGTDTLEMIILGNYYTNPIGDPPSGEWIIDSNGEYLVDNNDEFIYA